MRKYRFRLEQVRRVRTIELDRAVAEVARAQAARAEAAERTTAARRHYERLPLTPPGPTAGDLRAMVETRRLAGDAILAAQAVERVREDELRARLAEWAEADRNVRLLTELDERHRARHRAEVLADEQRQLDDLVTSRMGRAAR